MSQQKGGAEGGSTTEAEAKISRGFLLKLVAVPVLMFGFGYLMVPLYTVFCSVTGLNGKTGQISQAEVSQLQKVDRQIKVQFTSSVNQSGAWEFKPNQLSLMVQPGQPYSTSYFAHNLLNADVVSQSVPSVSPSKAATYFNKSECFCFTEQAFSPDESRDMALTFVVDPDLPDDVDTIILSYTLFTKSVVTAPSSKSAGKAVSKSPQSAGKHPT